MTPIIPDLWSDDIRVNVLAPIVILRSQVGFLESKTQGIVRAQVATTTVDEWAQHQLDLVAPALDQYRTTILTARHTKDSVYPVTLHSQAFVPTQTPSLMATIRATARMIVGSEDRRQANTQDEFIELVKEALHSGYVRTTIQSLIARSNETRATDTIGSTNGPVVT